MAKGTWLYIFTSGSKRIKRNPIIRNLIIFFGLIVLGVVYGYISALWNQNPYFPVPGGGYEGPRGREDKAWHWQPSPLFLPSYILCKVRRNGFGITRTRSGFLFRSEAKRSLYIRTSTILGGGIGLILAIATITIGTLKQRKRQTEPVGPADASDRKSEERARSK